MMLVTAVRRHQFWQEMCAHFSNRSNGFNPKVIDKKWHKNDVPPLQTLRPQKESITHMHPFTSGFVRRLRTSCDKLHR